MNIVNIQRDRGDGGGEREKKSKNKKGIKNKKINKKESKRKSYSSLLLEKKDVIKNAVQVQQRGLHWRPGLEY